MAILVGCAYKKLAYAYVLLSQSDDVMQQEASVGRYRSTSRRRATL